MLFDLQGKRRRVVQVTYLTLAILLGGGLVLFGIGSDVQGGLADIFSSPGQSEESGNPAAEDQLEAAEQRLAANPDDPRALAEVVRSNYQLATTTDEEARLQGILFAEDATGRLEAAADAWERYLEVEDNPDDALAFLMVQVLGEQGLNRPAEAADAAQVVADARRDPQAYLILTQYAALAGDDRRAELAGRRAVSLAPQSQQEQVQKQVDALFAAVEQIQAQQRQQQGAGGAGGGPGQFPLPGGGGLLPPGGGGGGGAGAP